MEATIAPPRSWGWLVTVVSPDNFPTGCFVPKQDGAEIISLEVGKKGRKERENFTEDTMFFNPHKGLEAWKASRPVLWCFSGGFLLLTSKMKFLFCPFLENVGIWDFWLIFCLGLLIQLLWIKIHCYSSRGGEGDWSWSSLLGPLIQRSLWDKEEWV